MSDLSMMGGEADPVALAHPQPMFKLLRDAGAVLVAVLLFGAFVRMLRKTKPDEIPMEMLSAQTEPEPVGSLAGGQQSSFSSSQPVTVDLINDMIRRKPDNIGAALRNWIETDKANEAG